MLNVQSISHCSVFFFSLNHFRSVSGLYPKAVLFREETNSLAMVQSFCKPTFDAPGSLVALLKTRELRPFRCSNHPVWLSPGVLSVSGRFWGIISLAVTMRATASSCLARAIIKNAFSGSGSSDSCFSRLGAIESGRESRSAALILVSSFLSL